jgi:AI-2 transport protein TqsA
MRDMSVTQGVDRESTLPRVLIILIGAGSAVLVVAGLRWASGIVGPTFLAIVLTVLVYPLRRYPLKRGWPAWSGPLVGIVAVYALLLSLTAAMVLATARFATLLPQYESDFNDLVQSGTAKLKDYGVGKAQIESVSKSFDASQFVSAAEGVLQHLLSLTSSLFFVVTLLLFLGIDATHFPETLNANREDRPAVVAALESFADGTRRYLVVATVFGLIVAVLDTIFLAFTPIPAPLLWGLLAFITNYIPNVGFVIGLVPPAILGLLEGGPKLMLLVIVVYSVLNVLIQSVIQPKVVGDVVGLSSSLTFVSLIFWAWVLGPVGALLAVPLSLLAKALLVDVDKDSRWLKPLLGSGAETAHSHDETTLSQSETDNRPTASVQQRFGHDDRYPE